MAKKIGLEKLKEKIAAVMPKKSEEVMEPAAEKVAEAKDPALELAEGTKPFPPVKKKKKISSIADLRVKAKEEAY